MNILDDVETMLVREGLRVDAEANTLTVRVHVLDDEDPNEDLPRICLAVLASGAVQISQYDSMTDMEPRKTELPAPTVDDVVAVVKKWFAWW